MSYVMKNQKKSFWHIMSEHEPTREEFMLGRRWQRREVGYTKGIDQISKVRGEKIQPDFSMPENELQYGIGINQA